jgi:hypothetical protein
MFRYPVEGPSHQVPEGVTTENISGQKHNVHHQNEASNAYPKTFRKEKGSHSVVDQKSPDQVREPQEITMKILQN